MSNACIDQDPAEIIARLGGNKATSEFFGVTPSAVTQWMANGIPKDKITILRLARPDVLGLPPVARKRRHATTATPP